MKQVINNLERVVLRVRSFHSGLVKWKDLDPRERELALTLRLILIKQSWWRDRVRRFGL